MCAELLWNKNVDSIAGLFGLKTRLLLHGQGTVWLVLGCVTFRCRSVPLPLHLIQLAGSLQPTTNTDTEEREEHTPRVSELATMQSD